MHAINRISGCATFIAGIGFVVAVTLLPIFVLTNQEAFLRIIGHFYLWCVGGAIVVKALIWGLEGVLAIGERVGLSNG